jgi:hypothetical protein
LEFLLQPQGLESGKGRSDPQIALGPCLDGLNKPFIESSQRIQGASNFRIHDGRKFGSINVDP